MSDTVTSDASDKEKADSLGATLALASSDRLHTIKAAIDALPNVWCQLFSLQSLI